MEHLNVTLTDLLQLLILLAAVITVVNSYGSRIKVLEKDAERQRKECGIAMGGVVSKQLLNSKMETLTKEMEHLNEGQRALYKKLDEVYRLLIRTAQKG